MEKLDKIRESKRRYGKKYNTDNISVQLNRNLISDLKKELGKDENIKSQSIKSFIENLIINVMK